MLNVQSKNRKLEKPEEKGAVMNVGLDRGIRSQGPPEVQTTM